MEVATGLYKVLGQGEGLRLQSGPGRDLIFKVTGEDTGGAFDYFIVEVAPRGGPPLHVHHRQEETIHVIGGGPNERMRDDAAQRAIDAPVDEETQSAISKRIDPRGIVGPAGVRVRRGVDVLLRG